MVEKYGLNIDMSVTIGPPMGLTVPNPSAMVRFDLNKNDSLTAGTTKAITT